jgi:hypothetical protein
MVKSWKAVFPKKMLVPNAATIEILGEDSGASKHVPCSATEKLATRYQLPATAPLAPSRYQGLKINL